MTHFWRYFRLESNSVKEEIPIRISVRQCPAFDSSFSQHFMFMRHATIFYSYARASIGSFCAALIDG